MFDVFSIPENKLPDGFLWGSGYAGHQVEGNNINSQWWANESLGMYDEVSGAACNSYELWEKDVDIARDLELKAFRTSVEWSRIEPSEGIFSPDALDHYVRFFARLKSCGIKVFATLVHFSVPLWFDKLGSFANPDNRKYFERYLEYVVPKLAPYVDFWNVLNEFNLQSADFKLGAARFHALGYHIIKKYSEAPVSSAHALVLYTPKRRYDHFDNVMADYIDLCNHEFFFHAVRTGELLYPFRDGIYLPELKGSVDYWSINTYVRDMIDARVSSGFGTRYDFAKMKMIDRDFYLEEFDPECIVSNLSRLNDLPIYITENGVACKDDRFRIVFLAEYITALCEAIKLGADVKGYLYWSLIDNFEWGSYKPTFGLYGVDFESGDFARTQKPSAAFYRDIIRENGISAELVKKHLKEIPTL